MINGPAQNTTLGMCDTWLVLTMVYRSILKNLHAYKQVNDDFFLKHVPILLGSHLFTGTTPLHQILDG
jgi:hypothetical protein